MSAVGRLTPAGRGHVSPMRRSRAGGTPGVETAAVTKPTHTMSVGFADEPGKTAELRNNDPYIHSCVMIISLSRGCCSLTGAKAVVLSHR
jgi:hypothetical protein